MKKRGEGNPSGRILETHLIIACAISEFSHDFCKAKFAGGHGRRRQDCRERRVSHFEMPLIKESIKKTKGYMGARVIWC